MNNKQYFILGFLNKFADFKPEEWPQIYKNYRESTKFNKLKDEDIKDYVNSIGEISNTHYKKYRPAYDKIDKERQQLIDQHNKNFWKRMAGKHRDKSLLEVEKGKEWIG